LIETTIKRLTIFHPFEKVALKSNAEGKLLQKLY